MRGSLPHPRVRAEQEGTAWPRDGGAVIGSRDGEQLTPCKSDASGPRLAWWEGCLRWQEEVNVTDWGSAWIQNQWNQPGL